MVIIGTANRNLQPAIARAAGVAVCGDEGHLDLTIPIRGDFQEGFQVYGEGGSVAAKVYLPWFHKSSDVECFSARDGQFRRPLGEDAHTYKRQVEGFADAILRGAPQDGADADDGLAAVQALVAIARAGERGQATLDAVAHEYGGTGLRELLRHLVAHEVVQHDEGSYRIVVGLYREWLLKYMGAS